MDTYQQIDPYSIICPDYKSYGYIIIKENDDHNIAFLSPLKADKLISGIKKMYKNSTETSLCESNTKVIECHKISINNIIPNKKLLIYIFEEPPNQTIKSELKKQTYFEDKEPIILLDPIQILNITAKLLNQVSSKKIKRKSKKIKRKKSKRKL